MGGFKPKLVETRFNKSLLYGVFFNVTISHTTLILNLGAIVLLASKLKYNEPSRHRRGITQL